MNVVHRMTQKGKQEERLECYVSPELKTRVLQQATAKDMKMSHWIAEAVAEKVERDEL